MTAEPSHRITPEEYLAMEESALTRSEFVDGLIMAMSGNTLPHVRIVRNLLVELDGQLRGKPCEVLSNELKVKVELTGDYFYPDLVGYCGTPIFERPNQITLLNPALLIEILSPSTEAYDRGEKFLHYQQIPTLREYVLVSQEAARVELYTRGENSAWIYKVVSGPDASVTFESIDCAVSLADIYRDVEFERQTVGGAPKQG
jgi:Uma2 family endonuclease